MHCLLLLFPLLIATTSAVSCVSLSDAPPRNILVTFLSGNDVRDDMSYWSTAITPTLAAASNCSVENAHTDMLLWLGNVVRSRGQTDPSFNPHAEFQYIRSNYFYDKFIQQTLQRNGGIADGLLDVLDIGDSQGNKTAIYGSKEAFQKFLGKNFSASTKANVPEAMYHFTSIPSSFSSPLSQFFVNSFCLIALDVLSSRSAFPDLNKVLLRWNTSAPPRYKRSTGSSREYFSDDILGDEQWAWLEETIETYSSVSSLIDGKEQCAVTVIASAWQVLLNDNKPFYGWDLYPASRSRLLDLLKRKRATRFVFLSGHANTGESGVLKRASSDNIMPGGLLSLYAQSIPFEPATKSSAELLPAVTPLVEVTSSGLSRCLFGNDYLGWLYGLAVRPVINESDRPKSFLPRYISLRRHVVPSKNFGILQLKQHDNFSDVPSIEMNRQEVLRHYSVQITLHIIDEKSCENGCTSDFIYESNLEMLPSYDADEDMSTPESIPQFSMYSARGEYPSLKLTAMSHECPEFHCSLRLVYAMSSFLPIVGFLLVLIIIVAMIGCLFLRRRRITPLRKKKLKAD